MVNVSAEIRKRIENKINDCLAIANKHYNPVCPFKMPKVEYNLHGTCGGLAYPTQWRLRFHPVFIAENTEDYIENTVPHEVAHLIDYEVHKLHVQGFGYRVKRRSIHGPTWRAVMRLLGANPARCHTYDTSNVQRKSSFMYECPCCKKEFRLGPTRHKKIQNGAIYWCSSCGRDRGNLVYQQANQSAKLAVTKPVQAKPPKAGSKIERAYFFVKNNKDICGRNSLIAGIALELNCSRAMAQTYYYTVLKRLEA
ncbi:MAG: SprT-like domain-containing protein [Candidatus Thermoplasmatota archaeon]